ncbi:MAG: cyclopropane fatty acyl phospholipid synthase [Verrucomicrobia bacterium]|nr:cyclopropane fatty acyl phospholipid synthase [Verrucomicrobiota bacterium]
MNQECQTTDTSPGRPVLEGLLSDADVRIGGDRPWDTQVHDDRFYARVLADVSLGLGEAYMDGWWDAEALDQFFYQVLRQDLDLKQMKRPGVLLDCLKARLINGQSKSRSKRVAECHYNLGNRFYERMLGPSMQYTCGYWKEAADLTPAQEAKLDLVCRKLQLRPGDRVLELGGGWGGFARFAAKHYGCEVTVNNISESQVDYARESCRDLPVEVRLDDYRNASGCYDKVVSIGMCEHVGALNYEAFFRLQRDCLKEDGLMLLHTIGRERTDLTADPWFTRYIFPGGQLPSLRQLTDAAEGYFVLEDFHNFGQDYDHTLMAWFRNFERHWPEFREEYGERFYRMWTYYLLSCAGSFRARRIHLWQLVFSPHGVEGGYQPVR